MSIRMDGTPEGQFEKRIVEGKGARGTILQLFTARKKPNKINNEEAENKSDEIDINDAESLNKYVSKFTNSFLLTLRGNKTKNTDEEKIFVKALLEKRLEGFLVLDVVTKINEQIEINNKKNDSDPTKDKELKSFEEVKMELSDLKNFDDPDKIAGHISKLLSVCEGVSLEDKINIKLPASLELENENYFVHSDTEAGEEDVRWQSFIEHLETMGESIYAKEAESIRKEKEERRTGVVSRIKRFDKIVFEQLIDRKKAEDNEATMVEELEKKGIYLPVNGLGGDGYIMIRKGTGAEKVILIDTVGHGEDEFAKKFIILNLLGKLEGLSDEEYFKKIKQINTFLHKCNDKDKTDASVEYSSIQVELKDDKKIVSCEFFGGNSIIVFEPEPKGGEPKVFVRKYTIKAEQGSLEGIEEGSFYDYSKLGNYEFKGDVFSGEKKDRHEGKERNVTFSKNAQVIAATDGLFDPTIRFKKDKNGKDRPIGQVLQDFVETWENNNKLKLVDFLKDEVMESEEVRDDVTFFEVGADLK